MTLHVCVECIKFFPRTEPSGGVNSLYTKENARNGSAANEFRICTWSISNTSTIISIGAIDGDGIW